jgi:MIP family channel proteins
MAGNVYCSIHPSGNLNPAVSVGLLTGGKLSLLKCVVYVIAQCIGSVIGAGILHLATPSQHRAGLGSNGLADGVTPLGGMVMELLMTMLLVLVVYATAVDTGNKTAPMVAPLVIGMTVTAAHLVLMPYTGTSINPARSLGPALVSSNTANHWVFWVGPLLGGALGGVLYRFGMLNNQVKSFLKIYGFRLTIKPC